MNCAGLIYDNSRHYLDHLGPICSLFRMPLVTLDPEIGELAKENYPELEVLDGPIPSTIVTCDSKPLLEAVFPHRTFTTYWLPHGNSDKPIDPKTLHREDHLLVYGPKMRALLGRGVSVGNFRYAYYRKHQSFYDRLWDLPSTEKLFLYAPTWDENGTFWEAFPALVKNLPKETHLLVKLHPNTLQKFAPEIEVFKGRYAKPNLHFLPDKTPIYPLLSRIDALITDISSIGYDFLTFEKPIYLLKKSFLPGTQIDPNTFSFLLEEQDPLPKRNLYFATFDENCRF
jgi:hypothetical protein